MKVLVTGAAGFVGSHIVGALIEAGHEVVAFDHRLHGKALDDAVLEQIEAAQGDVLDPAALGDAAIGCEAIYHCAAIVGVDAYVAQPARTMAVEQEGMRNVVSTALKRGARVIFASSSAVYGASGGSEPLREDQPVTPTSHYGLAKRFNEQYLAAEHQEHQLDSVALRIFNVYGPRQDQRLVIPRFVRKALDHEPLVLFGDGSQSRDFVHVGYVARAAVACLDLAPGVHVLNVASGREVTILEIAKRIIALTGSRSTIEFKAVSPERTVFEVARCVGSPQRLVSLTGLGDDIALDEGLTSVIDYMNRTP